MLALDGDGPRRGSQAPSPGWRGSLRGPCVGYACRAPGARGTGPTCRPRYVRTWLQIKHTHYNYKVKQDGWLTALTHDGHWAALPRGNQVVVGAETADLRDRDTA